jgi:hypothetical protein
MKKAILIVLVTITTFLSFSQNCENLKIGTWKVIDENDESNNTYITREDEYQIEETPGIGIKVKSKITWTSDCSYTLTTEKVLENKNNIEFPETFFNSDIICVVKEQTDDYYIVITTIEGVDDFKMEIKYINK